MIRVFDLAKNLRLLVEWQSPTHGYMKICTCVPYSQAYDSTYCATFGNCYYCNPNTEWNNEPLKWYALLFSKFAEPTLVQGVEQMFTKYKAQLKRREDMDNARNKEYKELNDAVEAHSKQILEIIKREGYGTL